MEKYGFIYRWYDKKRDMKYIGCHWGTEDDGYICSSPRMRKAYRRRKDDFSKEVLKTNIERESLLLEEYKFLKEIPKEELGKKYYNLHNHHFGHWTTDENKRLSIGEKISKTQKQKGIIPPSRKGATYESKLKGKPGTPHTEESKEKLRQAQLGRKHSGENILKMSKPRKNTENMKKPRQTTENMKAINNPNCSKKLNFDIATQIRLDKENGDSYSIISKRYKISNSTAWDIVSNKTWVK